jgi:signal transduction histidine kinase
MVAREALYNSVRHAQPKKVDLRVTFEENKCQVRVRDDGSGFDPTQLSRLPENHYGLIGIKERVERIGGTFSLRSEVGTGTELSIEVPRRAGASANSVSEVAL